MKVTAYAPPIAIGLILLLVACGAPTPYPELDYEVLERHDVPVRAVDHTRYDVRLAAEATPTETSLRQVALQVWRSGDHGNEQVRVRIFLAGTDPAGDAYATATLNKYGLRHLQVNR